MKCVCNCRCEDRFIAIAYSNGSAAPQRQTVRDKCEKCSHITSRRLSVWPLVARQASQRPYQPRRVTQFISYRAHLPAGMCMSSSRRATGPQMRQRPPNYLQLVSIACATSGVSRRVSNALFKFT